MTLALPRPIGSEFLAFLSICTVSKRISGRVQVRLSKDFLANTQSPNANFLSPVAHCAQITVSNTGQGIAQDFLPYVFNYFRQADGKTTRQVGGLGLELPIVKHIVEMHGSTVSAHSAGEGQGATFIVKLPLMTAPSPPTKHKESSQSEKFFILKGLRVLVVDDEADSRELVAFVLQEYGVKVTTVISALPALQAATNIKPDVLVLDIDMPQIDGYMLLRQIRSLSSKQGGNTLAITLTAYEA
jgi:CheY-like chemotaxis protein